MTLKEHVHKLVDELPDDSSVLADFRETLRMNQALKEAVADVEAGRIFEADELLAHVKKRWPLQNSE